MGSGIKRIMGSAEWTEDDVDRKEWIGVELLLEETICDKELVLEVVCDKKASKPI